jgi:predicted Zn-dependent protease
MGSIQNFDHGDKTFGPLSFPVRGMKTRIAVVSVYRLRSSDRKLYMSRVRKEVVYMVGHFLDLKHCI